MPKNPFDETPFDRASRQLREFGGRSAIEEMLKQDRMVRDLLDPPMMRAIRESAGVLKQFEEDQRKTAETFALLGVDMLEVTRQAAAFQREIARSIGPQIDAYERQLRELVAPLGGLAAELARDQRAIANAFSVFSAEELAGLTGTAARALRQHYELLAETAQFGVEGTDAALEVVQALEAAESGAPTAAAVAEALITALVKLLTALVRNTDKRVRQLDLIDIFFILATIQQLQPDYTDDDRTRDENTFEIVQRIEEQVKQVAAARTAESAYVNSLPKAVVVGAGRIREAPTADAKIRDKLPKDAVVAIVDKQGRWRRVIYRDQLTGDLAEGWIWSASVNELDD